MFVTRNDLNVKHGKLLLDAFFMKHKEIKEAFDEALIFNNNSKNFQYEYYQELANGEGILKGFKTYKGYKLKNNYDSNFLIKHPDLHSLLTFIHNINELEKRLPINRHLDLTMRVKNSILHRGQLPGLRLELDIFTFFCIKENFTLIDFDFPKGKPNMPEMTIEKNGIIFDIECKTINPLVGHPINLSAADKLLNLLIKDKSTNKILVSNSVVDILINKTLISKNDYMDSNAYTPIQLFQEIKENLDAYIKIGKQPVPYIEKYDVEESKRTIIFKNASNNSYVRIISSVKNNYIDKLFTIIGNAASGKKYFNPKIIVLRPTDVNSSYFLDEKFKDQFYRLVISLQEEGLFILCPFLTQERDYNEGKLVGLKKGSEVIAVMTEEFKKKYQTLFLWLTSSS